MCTEVVMLNGARISTPRQLRQLGIEPGADTPDDVCLCWVPQVDELMREHNFLIRGGSWNPHEYDTEGRTFSDAYEPDPDAQHTEGVVCQRRRADWPYGFAGEDEWFNLMKKAVR